MHFLRAAAPPPRITFKEMAVVYSMVVLIPLALQTIVLVRTLSDQHGMFYALVCVFSRGFRTQARFSPASSFGKAESCARRSAPKRLWRVSSAACCPASSFAARQVSFSHLRYLRRRTSAQTGALAALYHRLFGAFVSVLGDLSFSALIKRSCHIKDFGSVIPATAAFWTV